MMKTWKKVVSALLSMGTALVGVQAVAATVAAYGPSVQAGTYVKSTTYYFCSSSSHTALDICVDTTGAKSACGACNATNVLSMLNGSYYYALSYGSCASDCDSVQTDCGGGAGNYYTVTGGNGYDFRQLHFNPNADLKSKTAGRGTYMGWLGSTGSSTAPHVHADNRRNGTRLSAWYSAYVSCGSPATSSNAIGQVTLQ